ncbi:MAG: Hsp20/alpha crystallin family protein [Methylococcaceae bacterium]|jgi:HSP20 family molecular chaperone IbpA
MAAEVFDNDDRVIVRLEAPGMDKKEFDLQVIDDALIVSGEKSMQKATIILKNAPTVDLNVREGYLTK